MKMTKCVLSPPVTACNNTHQVNENDKMCLVTACLLPVTQESAFDFRTMCVWRVPAAQWTPLLLAR
jgi:hypothetical protein